MPMIIYTTFTNRESAINIANDLVKQQLAACVQINEIDSIYIWDDTLQNSREIRLSIKTSKHLCDEVFAFLKSNHEYETPQIIAVKIDRIDSDYEKWLYSNTK